MWNIAYQFTGDISPDYETVRHRFVVAMYGDRQRKARWRECVSSTSAALSMAVGKLFVEETFDEDSKMRVSSTKLRTNFYLKTLNFGFIIKKHHSTE
jgi:predicted metalloendopeptidase